MTDNTGEPPQRPEDEPGYWERKAAEESAGQSPEPGVEFNPQSGYVTGQTPPPVSPPPYPAPGVPGPTNPYATHGGQPGYPPPPGQPGWGPRPGFPTYVLPDLPKATTALVLGLIALGGGFMCLLPIVVSPFAWAVGASARKEIRNAPNQWGGEGKATAGMVLGIIGTVLFALGLIVVIVIIAVAVGTSSDGSGTTGTGV
jgi:hypothetical protein